MDEPRGSFLHRICSSPANQVLSEKDRLRLREELRRRRSYAEIVYDLQDVLPDCGMVRRDKLRDIDAFNSNESKSMACVLPAEQSNAKVEVARNYWDAVVSFLASSDVDWTSKRCDSFTSKQNAAISLLLRAGLLESQIEVKAASIDGTRCVVARFIVSGRFDEKVAGVMRRLCREWTKSRDETEFCPTVEQHGESINYRLTPLGEIAKREVANESYETLQHSIRRAVELGDCEFPICHPIDHKIVASTPLTAIDTNSALELLASKVIERSTQNKGIVQQGKRKRGRKYDKWVTKRADFARPFRTQEVPLSYGTIYEKYIAKHKSDSKASPATIRLAFDRRGRSKTDK